MKTKRKRLGGRMPLKVAIGIAWTIGVVALLILILSFHQAILGI